MRHPDRRQFLKTLSVGSIFFTVPGAFAQELTRTPRQTEGPYYPRQLPLDKDNDLLIIGDSLTPAIGEVTHLSGRILTASGSPVRNATVEIWQADNTGAYIHTASRGYAARDKSFQGFGQFLTDSSGVYRFRTIKPGLYPGRTRHIHFKVKSAGQPDLVTQCYIAGEPGNSRDGVLRGIRDVDARNSVVVPFVPIPGSSGGELSAQFDIVL